MPWNNRQSTIKDSAGPSYPYIQLVNDGNSLDPRSANGGFAMPVEQSEAAGFVPAGMEQRNLIFRDNAPTPVFFGEYLEVAPMVTRFAWIKDGHRISAYVDGARGKLQLLCYVKDSEGCWMGPVMLTATGLASKDISDAIKTHRERVYKATRGKAPAALFGMILTAGETQMGGSKQKSKVTPIVLESDFDADRDYVGDTVADEVEACWEGQFKPWSDAWKNNPGPNGDGEVPGTEEYEDNASAAPAPSRPAPAPSRTAAPARPTPAPAPSRTATPSRPAAPAAPPAAPSRTAAPAAVQYGATLPFKSPKYQTIQQIFDAKDVESLESLIGWFESKGFTTVPAYTQACEAMIRLTPQTPQVFEEEELPF
jgi:hypothetical protein